MEKLGSKILVNFASKVRNMNINDVGGGVEMIVEDFFRDHGSGDDLAWMSHEEFKKGIFFGSEFDLDFFPKNPVSIGF
jgi:hypothetical protein